MYFSDYIFWRTSTFQLLDVQVVVTAVVLPWPPPGYCLYCLLAHRVQHPLIVDFSSGVANSRSRAFRKSISAQDDKLHEYALGGIRTHEADLLYHARGYNLIRHRGSD